MKYLFTISALALLTFSISGADLLDVGSRARLRSARIGLSASKDSSGKVTLTRKSRPGSPLPLRAFLIPAPGVTADRIAALDGVTLTGVRRSILLAEIEENALGEIENSGLLSRVILESPLSGKMDRVRTLTNVDKIHAGEDLARPYTGEGVVAGIVDSGFDPNHLNFLNEDGSSRITHFTYYRPVETGGYAEEKYDADYMPVIDCENDDTFHGTHSLGIMAGSYINGYQGIATGAEIAASCGALTDYYVVLGIESILDYAYEAGKPSVVNLSMGSNTGPHDGTSPMCQYLDEISELDNVVVCISAGNEGELPIALSQKFSEENGSIGTFLYPETDFYDYPNLRCGQVYIYGDDETPFEVQAIVVNRARGSVSLRMPIEAEAGQVCYWVSSADYAESDTDIISAPLGKNFSGYVGLGSEVEETSGRYCAVLDCMLWDNEDNNEDGQYILGFLVKGKEDHRVDIYGDGLYNTFNSYGLEGYADGMTDGSITDTATGKHTIVVGSYNSRCEWENVDGSTTSSYRDILPEGEISSFSSYGRLADGRELPTVCAPGAAVISSSNEYYLIKHNATEKDIQSRLKTDARNYSWQQSIGTSMAAPVVSGSIALWLEADPTLKAWDVQDIIAKTSIRDSFVESSGKGCQWGAGKFDAYAGLKEVIARNAGVGAITAHGKKSLEVISDGNGRYTVSSFTPGELRLSLYEVSGRKLREIRSASGRATLDLNGTLLGCYILSSANGESHKLIIK